MILELVRTDICEVKEALQLGWKHAVQQIFASAKDTVDIDRHGPLDMVRVMQILGREG